MVKEFQKQTYPDNMRSNVIDTLEAIAQANPETVTIEILDQVFGIVVDGTRSPEVRSAAAHIFTSLAWAKPEHVTPGLLDSLFEIVNDSQADESLRTTTAGTLGQLAQVNPESLDPKMIQSLIALLKSGTDSPGRIAAAYALFGFSLGDQNQENLIREDLEGMTADPQPYIRMAAYRTLDMMSIGNWVQEARSNSDQIERFKSNLRDLKTLADGYILFAVEITQQEIENLK